MVVVSAGAEESAGAGCAMEESGLVAGELGAGLVAGALGAGFVAGAAAGVLAAVVDGLGAAHAGAEKTTANSAAIPSGRMRRNSCVKRRPPRPPSSCHRERSLASNDGR